MNMGKSIEGVPLRAATSCLTSFVARQSLASQRDALFNDFLFARKARIFVSQRSALLTEFSCGKLALILLARWFLFLPFRVIIS